MMDDFYWESRAFDSEVREAIKALTKPRKERS